MNKVLGTDEVDELVKLLMELREALDQLEASIVSVKARISRILKD